MNSYTYDHLAVAENQQLEIQMLRLAITTAISEKKYKNIKI